MCLAKYRLYMPFETISDAAFTLRHSGTQDTWDTLFSRLQGTTLTGILTMFAKFLDCHH